MWIEDADCSVFLYAEGHSRRGPSFQISSEDLINTQSTSLLACARPQPDFVAGEGGIPVLQDTSSNKVELYLAAPPSTKGDDAFRWHITTRNFFAWVRGKPLVGEHLGVALADLYERMRMWRPESPDLAEDVLVYADMMGYTVVEESPDHALAMLYFGEVSRLRNVWIDAFVHCVGMNTSLGSSTEFDVRYVMSQGRTTLLTNHSHSPRPQKLSSRGHIWRWTCTSTALGTRLALF